MENKKILTISVAAYNLENYIEQNLKTLTNTKYNDLLEIIVTDDGSKDKTTEIVQQYVNKFPNTVKLIKQKNAGPGSTVNSGIKNASGKYFKMIDGDDWVESDQLEILLDKLINIDLDMVITNYETFDNSKNQIIKLNKPNNISKDIIYNFEQIAKTLSLDMHNVLYKTEILKNNNITLDNGFYTDVEYLLLPAIYIKNVVYYDLNIYVYRVSRIGQSVSLESSRKHLDMHDLVLNRLINYYNDNKKLKNVNIMEYIKNRIAVMADSQLTTLLSFKMDKNQKNKIKEYNKELKEKSIDIYIKYKEGKKVKLLIYSNYLLIGIISKIIIKKFST